MGSVSGGCRKRPGNFYFFVYPRKLFFLLLVDGAQSQNRNFCPTVVALRGQDKEGGVLQSCWGLKTRELSLGKTLDIIGPTMKLMKHTYVRV